MYDLGRSFCDDDDDVPSPKQVNSPLVTCFAFWLSASSHRFCHFRSIARISNRVRAVEVEADLEGDRRSWPYLEVTPRYEMVDFKTL